MGFWLCLSIIVKFAVNFVIWSVDAYFVIFCFVCNLVIFLNMILFVYMKEKDGKLCILTDVKEREMGGEIVKFLGEKQ